MQIEPAAMGDVLIVRVHEPRIDAASAIQFKDTLRAAAEGGPSRVVLDLSEVGFVDSSGLGAVVAAMKLLAPDQTLELAGLTDTVAKVFRLTRMDTVFRIHDRAEAAAGRDARVA